MDKKTYVSIDLKSFYASVECIEMGLDPLNTNLVVADNSRSEKTICLAVSPTLKSYGIKGRPRLFEVIQKIDEVNAIRLSKLKDRVFLEKSFDYKKINSSDNIAVDYIVARPRMAKYIEYSTKIYNIYLKYVSEEDIHVYSIDEVFIDITNYLETYNLTSREITTKILLDILENTGITATAGIGSNLYLSKVAMDILAKKIPIDKSGVQIAELDEMSYRRKLWSHRPITDFWRVGRGYEKRLEKQGLYTMGDIARCSIGKPTDYHNENLLYKMFGINAELLIDHAWGWESCTMKDIKEYKPLSKSISSGQVLHSPYTFKKGKLIVWEMTDLLVLDLVSKRLVTNQISLRVGYDRESLLDPKIKKIYKGQTTIDDYGRIKPKSAHGSINLDSYTSSTKNIINAVMQLFDELVDENLLIRRVNISANNIIEEENVKDENKIDQLNLFTDYKKLEEEKKKEEIEKSKERKIQETILNIKEKYGKSAVIKATNLKEGATTLDRNKQIGGHRA
ncbi:MAG TPA: DNA methylase [Tissierellaceae bacterium]